VNEPYPKPKRERAYLYPRLHMLRPIIVLSLYATEHNEDILLDTVLRITYHERPKRFERQQEAISSPLGLGKSRPLLQMGHIGPAMFFADRKGAISTSLLDSVCPGEDRTTDLITGLIMTTRSKAEMTTGRKSTNFWKSGPDDIVLTTSLMSEGTYLSPIDDIEIRPRRITRGQHEDT